MCVAIRFFLRFPHPAVHLATDGDGVAKVAAMSTRQKQKERTNFVQISSDGRKSPSLFVRSFFSIRAEARLKPFVSLLVRSPAEAITATTQSTVIVVMCALQLFSRLFLFLFFVCFSSRFSLFLNLVCDGQRVDVSRPRARVCASVHATSKTWPCVFSTFVRKKNRLYRSVRAAADEPPVLPAPFISLDEFTIRQCSHFPISFAAALGCTYFILLFFSLPRSTAFLFRCSRQFRGR